MKFLWINRYVFELWKWSVRPSSRLINEICLWSIKRSNNSRTESFLNGVGLSFLDSDVEPQQHVKYEQLSRKNAISKMILATGSLKISAINDVSFAMIWFEHNRMMRVLHSSWRWRAEGFHLTLLLVRQIEWNKQLLAKRSLSVSAASLSPTTRLTKELNYFNAFLTTGQDFLTFQEPRRSRIKVYARVREWNMKKSENK